MTKEENYRYLCELNEKGYGFICKIHGFKP